MKNAYQTLLEQFTALSAQYASLPMDAVLQAYDRAAGNPFIQNRRVKQVPSFPAAYSKDTVANAILTPGEHEQMLRQVHHALEATAYPMRKIRKVLTDILTYRYYTAPCGINRQDAETPAFRREMALLDQINRAIEPQAAAHRITGQAIQEGKVFYAPRLRVDKAHGRVSCAMLQQLPSDWVKIVGWNSVSGYTVSFNLFYFLQPGTDWRQYGDLFAPYWLSLQAVVEQAPSKTVYGSAGYRVNLDRLRALQGRLAGTPDAYEQNGQWCYWVTLPPGRVFVFEIDDTDAVACSPLTGLYLSMQSISQYEQVQLELVQNPLISVMTGEIPYANEPTPQMDQYKLSDGGRILFETLWYNMLAQNNTAGIGLFLAPADNLKLHQLTEAPGATQISTQGYAYAIEKSGLAGLIPISDNPRAGTVNLSIQIEARYCMRIYQQFEKMMNHLYQTLHLRYDWRFHMFGDIYSDERMRTEMHKSMALGILPDLYRYNALMDRSLLDDSSMSAAVLASGILQMRQPLQTSYNAAGTPAPLQDTGGRSAIDTGDLQSEATEDARDAE